MNRTPRSPSGVTGSVRMQPYRWRGREAQTSKPAQVFEMLASVASFGRIVSPGSADAGNDAKRFPGGMRVDGGDGIPVWGWPIHKYRSYKSYRSYKVGPIHCPGFTP
jgi:hypothetical protein